MSKLKQVWKKIKVELNLWMTKIKAYILKGYMK